MTIEGGGRLGRKVGHRLLVRMQMFKTHSQAPGALGRRDRGHGEMHTWESDEFRVRDACASAFGTEAAPGCREDRRYIREYGYLHLPMTHTLLGPSFF